MDAALLFFGFIWALLSGKGSASSPSSASSSAKAPAGTPPWPQVVPSELARFPGPGWEFDEPPPRAVQQRAAALVDQLWAQGSGAFKTEQTDGRWVTYQAQIVRSGGRGVVAYRLKQVAEKAPGLAPPEAVARRVPTSPVVPASYSTSSTSSPSSATTRASSLPVQLSTVRYGAGLRPAAPNPDVKLLQQSLGLEPDGRFGNDTRAAVVRYQAQRGLVADGVVGPATWASLLARKTA